MHLKPTESFDLPTYLADVRGEIDRALQQRLPSDSPDDPLGLRRAMRQAVLAGGKRLRPCLVVASCQAVGGSLQQALGPACAVEMVHAYSLVHDDLPAMDDDDTRRGQPTIHRAFGEATAILAGNGLLTLAFETLASEADARSDARARLASAALARAAGVGGMIGGQALDLELKQRDPDFETLERCHVGKTAALFSASTLIGAAVGGGDAEQRERLEALGLDLGLAFQHADDLLDAEFRQHRASALASALALSRRARDAARSFGDAGAALAALAELVEARASGA